MKMNKDKVKVNIFHRIACSVIAHPWLKLISLLLAIIIWFYAKGKKI